MVGKKFVFAAADRNKTREPRLKLEQRRELCRVLACKMGCEVRDDMGQIK
jgi:hypothetical protein